MSDCVGESDRSAPKNQVWVLYTFTGHVDATYVGYTSPASQNLFLSSCAMVFFGTLWQRLPM
eukprot:m.181534 g.181534  ORF g.181534 m.181534 type:complete len:62 (+) comp14663_c0_seq1:43-228(+)